jgi:hypothetical protein
MVHNVLELLVVISSADLTGIEGAKELANHANTVQCLRCAIQYSTVVPI